MNSLQDIPGRVKKMNDRAWELIRGCVPLLEVIHIHREEAWITFL